MAFIPFNTIKLFASEFEKELSSYSVEKYSNGERISVYVLNDSLAILVQIVGYSCSLCLNPEQMYGYYRKIPFLEFPVDGKEYYHLRIEELTPNVIGFQYNNTKFCKRMQEITGISYLDVCIFYSRYTSQRDEYWRYFGKEFEVDATKRIDKLFPQLHLEERCKNWSGEKYYYIVLELEDADGQIHRTVAYTTSKPHVYVNYLCKEWIRTGRFFGNAIMASGIIENEINNAFSSWKGMRRQARLEEHLKYFFVEKDFQSKFDAEWYARDVLKAVKSGAYDGEERSCYLRPVNKWVSEEMVYKIIRRYYGKKYAVIYQHRPFFLRSPKGGQMSYDVFISVLNIAVEYQGKQHFEPVDFFGGEESFKALKERDAEKMRLSTENGIKLVYINYWDEISPQLIIDRIGVKPN